MKEHKGTEPLVKHTLAKRLREEIITGRLALGVRIVEGTWGRKFGVAQASIRETINILAQEGFVTKASGRSARVVKLSEQDVVHLFELRGALEGLAARLAANIGADTAELVCAMDQMREASESGRAEDILDADKQFHLCLCDLSGNPHLQQYARRLLLPFFAFARMRVVATGQSTALWAEQSRPLEGGKFLRVYADNQVLRRVIFITVQGRSGSCRRPLTEMVVAETLNLVKLPSCR